MRSVEAKENESTTHSIKINTTHMLTVLFCAIPNVTHSTWKHEKKYLLKPLAQLGADDEVLLGIWAGNLAYSRVSHDDTGQVHDGWDGWTHHRQAHNVKEHIGCMGPQKCEGEVANTGGGCTASVRWWERWGGGKRFVVDFLTAYMRGHSAPVPEARVEFNANLGQVSLQLRTYYCIPELASVSVLVRPLQFSVYSLSVQLTSFIN